MRGLHQMNVTHRMHVLGAKWPRERGGGNLVDSLHTVPERVFFLQRHHGVRKRNESTNQALHRHRHTRAHIGVGGAVGGVEACAARVALLTRAIRLDNTQWTLSSSLSCPAAASPADTVDSFRCAPPPAITWLDKCSTRSATAASATFHPEGPACKKESGGVG